MYPTPRACGTEAPAHVNVYTDGGWQYSDPLGFGLGGAGVYWPKRITHPRLADRAPNLYVLEESSAEAQLLAGGVVQAEAIPEGLLL